MVRRHALCRPQKRWACWIAGVAGSFAVLEYAGWPDDTLSHFLRDVGRTDVPVGRAVFITAVALGGYALARHILSPEDNWLVEVTSDVLELKE